MCVIALTHPHAWYIIGSRYFFPFYWVIIDIGYLIYFCKEQTRKKTVKEFSLHIEVTS